MSLPPLDNLVRAGQLNVEAHNELDITRMLAMRRRWPNFDGMVIAAKIASPVCSV